MAQQTTSYSRLTSYPKCPTKYNYTYENKILDNLIETVEESLITGTLAHSLLEDYLNSEERGDVAKDKCVDKVVTKWLQESCKLVPREENGFILAEIDLNSIKHYIKEIGRLYRRGGRGYEGEDAIRNGDNSVPKDMIKHPPAALKKEISNRGLYNIGLDINNSATELNTQFRRITLTDILGKAAFYFYSFSVPEWVKRTIGVELRFDNYKVEWKNKIWLGGIDWVFETNGGAVVICDHKTEKEKTSGIDVLYHPQLNLYVNLYQSIFNRTPDYIAINHLPSSELVVAEVDLSIVNSVVKGLGNLEDEIQNSIRTNRWRRPLAPFEYNSPCITRDWQTKNLSRVCKFFKHCWPDYALNIEDELINFEKGVGVED